MTPAAKLGPYLADELRRAEERSRGRERYLDNLIALEQQRGRHPTKRANWLKFCADCGLDISDYPRGVRQCVYCAVDRGVAPDVARAVLRSSRGRKPPEWAKRARAAALGATA